MKQQANVVWGFPASNEWRLPKDVLKEEPKLESEQPESEEMSAEGRSRGESKEVEEEEKKGE